MIDVSTLNISPPARLRIGRFSVVREGETWASGDGAQRLGSIDFLETPGTSWVILGVWPLGFEKDWSKIEGPGLLPCFVP